MPSPTSHEPDRYELLGELASGGMGTVYLGRQRGPFGFVRAVAIKSMHPQFASDPAFRAMFIDEAKLTAKIRHPNVVPTVDIVSSTNRLILVMDYVEGVTLATMLAAAKRSGQPLSIEVIAAIVLDMLRGLAAAHDLRNDAGERVGVIHRDVCPHNVLVGIDGHARVADFGVAKSAERLQTTTNGETKGKLGYMAPEQLFHESIDHLADIYSVGVVLWEALADRRLFEGMNERIIARRVAGETVERPSSYTSRPIPAALEDVAMRALASKADERFATAAEMAKAIADIVTPAQPETVADVVRSLGAEQLARHAELKSAAPRDGEDTEHAAVLAVLGADKTTQVRQRASSRVVPVVAAAFAAVALVAAVWFRPAPRTVVEQAMRSEPPRIEGIPNEAPHPPSSAAPAVASASAAPSAPIAPPRAASAQPPKPPRTGAAPSAAARDCSLPYEVDGNGSRHYKAECLQ